MVTQVAVCKFRVVLGNGLGDADLAVTSAEVDFLALVGDPSVLEAGQFCHDRLQHLFGQANQVLVVGVCPVEFKHREFGIVPGRHAFIAKIAVDLVNLFQAANYQPLEMQLGRDAQVEIQIQGIVMGHERSRGRTARNVMHHRRFHLEKVPGNPETGGSRE